MTWWQALAFFAFFWSAGLVATVAAIVAAWKGWM